MRRIRSGVYFLIMSEADEEASENSSRFEFLRTIYANILGSRSAKIGVVIVVAIMLFIILGSLLSSFPPNKATTDLNSPPTWVHPFGTDYLGHDLFSQVVWGLYPSLLTALYSALGATLLGFFAGILAGYFGKLESIIGGATDVIMIFPALPLLILIATIFLASNEQIGILLILVLWAPIARAVRAQVLSVKKLAFVDAARTSGYNNRQVILRIIVYEVASIAIAYFIINLTLGIVFVTALQFLGVGNPVIVTWGSILYWAQQYGFTMGDWWWILAPGVIITLIATGFALIGFSFEEVANPRLKV